MTVFVVFFCLFFFFNFKVETLKMYSIMLSKIENPVHISIIMFITIRHTHIISVWISLTPRDQIMPFDAFLYFGVKVSKFQMYLRISFKPMKFYC